MMHFRCGTFAAPTTIGESSFDTGLPGTPTALFLTTAGTATAGTIGNAARIAFGATDGTNQWTACAGVTHSGGSRVVDADDVMDGQHTDTKVLRIINHSGTTLAEAEIVSLNADGTVTLDWTTVDASNAYLVGFAAWDQVTALAGTTDVVEDGTTTVTTGFEAKLVLGANAVDVNDGTISIGWSRNALGLSIGLVGGTSTDGVSYDVRVDTSDDFNVEQNVGHPYGFDQPAALGEAIGDINNFTSTGFDIVTSTTTIVFATHPVGWLAIGGGGDWFARGDGLGLNNVTWQANDLHPLGCLHASAETATANKENVSWGAWDPEDNQWTAVNYLEQDTGAGDNFAVTGRVFYNDRVDAALTNMTTVKGYRQLALRTSPPDQTPAVTTTGSPGSLTTLFFVTQNPDEAVGFTQAWLV